MSIRIAIVMALLFVAGCTTTGNSNASPEQVEANIKAQQAQVEFYSQLARKSGAMFVVAFNGSPSTRFQMVNGFEINNPSNMNGIFIVDPSKAWLQEESTTAHPIPSP